jgi:hypothetical protein
MGCDIHIVAQRKDHNGVYGDLCLDVFDYRSYSLFAFLAGIRNYSAIKPIAEPRGLPDGFNLDYDSETHNHSWLSIKELVEFDYEQELEDRRCAGGDTAPFGMGIKMTYREYLGNHFFEDLATLKANEADRIVFCFDN